MDKLLVVAVTSLAVALAGCHVSTSPQTVATVGGRNAPSMMRAPWIGTYTLYKMIPDGKQSQRTPVQSIRLKKDDPLGFRARETGPVAVAADLEIPVDGGTYQWVMQPDPGQTDPVATAILVVVIVVVAGIAIAVLYSAAENAASLFKWH